MQIISRTVYNNPDNKEFKFLLYDYSSQVSKLFSIIFKEQELLLEYQGATISLLESQENIVPKIINHTKSLELSFGEDTYQFLEVEDILEVMDRVSDINKLLKGEPNQWTYQ